MEKLGSDQVVATKFLHLTAVYHLALGEILEIKKKLEKKMFLEIIFFRVVKNSLTPVKNPLH